MYVAAVILGFYIYWLWARRNDREEKKGVSPGAARLAHMPLVALPVIFYTLYDRVTGTFFLQRPPHPFRNRIVDDVDERRKFLKRLFRSVCSRPASASAKSSDSKKSKASELQETIRGEGDEPRQKHGNALSANCCLLKTILLSFPGENQTTFLSLLVFSLIPLRAVWPPGL